MINYVDRLGIA